MPGTGSTHQRRSWAGKQPQSGRASLEFPSTYWWLFIFIHPRPLGETAALPYLFPNWLWKSQPVPTFTHLVMVPISYLGFFVDSNSTFYLTFWIWQPGFLLLVHTQITLFLWSPLDLLIGFWSIPQVKPQSLKNSLFIKHFPLIHRDYG